MPTKEMVLHILSGINDPELKKPLTELDMVKFVEIDGGHVTVGITLTVPGCPLKDKITSDVTAGLRLIPDVESVKVVFDVMSDGQRACLREKLGHGTAPDGRHSGTIGNFA